MGGGGSADRINKQQLRPTRIRDNIMNEFNDDLFTFINGELIEFSIRELINYQFNLRIFDENPPYTKEEKIEFMKSLIEDIEMCIAKVEIEEEINEG